ncbi:MAG TPA: cupin domain-containing protein [Burkholderiales bacterium]|nr:cupin domain-containing protein [Burkholderiales bacterium]
MGRKGALAAALVVAIAVPAAFVYAGLRIDEKGFVTLKPGEEEWKDYPGIEGIKVMVLEGDLKKPGPYVIRVKFSPGTMSMPHYHPEDRLVTVIKGTWWAGKGETFDPKSTEPLPTGSFMKHPSKAAHYDGAKDGEVIVQIAGIGPSDTIFFKPELGRTGKSIQ